MLETRTLAPEQPKEFRRAKRVHVSTEKCLQPPANVRAGPRTQPVALGSRPVVTQSREHQRGYFQPSRARSAVMCAT